MNVRMTKANRELLTAVRDGNVRTGLYNEPFLVTGTGFKALGNRVDALGALVRFDAKTKTYSLTEAGTAAHAA